MLKFAGYCEQTDVSNQGYLFLRNSYIKSFRTFWKRVLSAFSVLEGLVSYKPVPKKNVHLKIIILIVNRPAVRFHCVSLSVTSYC